MTKIKIIKRDGRIEDFNPKKIYNACISAGASEEITKKVVDSVIKDLHQFKTEMIRKKVLDKLKEFDKDVAYNWIKYDIQHTM